MRYRHISFVGASIIATLSILAALMYAFNQDACPAGSFLCYNTTDCLPQRNWCNKIPECLYGNDETDELCFDSYGTLDRFLQWISTEMDWWSSQNHDCSNIGVKDIDESKCVEGCGNIIPHNGLQVWMPFSVDIGGDVAGCTYEECSVTCTGYEEIPQNLSSIIRVIDLSNNSITRVPAGALSRYKEVIALLLEKNDIIELEKNAFENQGELSWLLLSNNSISEIMPGHLTGINKLKTLDAESNKINRADFSDLENSTTIHVINLQNNLLSESTLKFPYLPTLREIYLDENCFTHIPKNLFANCTGLKSMSMEWNLIRSIDENAFMNTENIVELNLANNKITYLPADVFKHLKKLTKLMIGYNPIKDLPMIVLEPLTRIRSLALQDISMDSLGRDAFRVLPQLEFVYFKKFHYCASYAPMVQKCKPESDGVSSLSHLLGKPLLRAAVWGISSVTCMGNALVLWGRFTAKDENRVLSIMIRNLAVSDMLMGIYLFIIAVTDVMYRDNYHQFAGAWMSSWPCTCVGMLAMTSSEVSVLILIFMSMERFMLIAAPLGRHHTMTPQMASASMIIIWILGIILALIPAIHWRNSTRFYGVNGMCFPLHIDDPYLIGWQYSAFIFLGLNLLGLVTIGYAYAGMFASIWKTRHATPLSVGDSEFALRFFLIVLTDAVCWAPIIILKIFAMLKYPVPADLHSWVIVFILPVNSAVNPLLYTFTTPKFRERLSDGWFGKIRIVLTNKRHF